ncbi:MAG: hypothetical protein EOM50_14315 [Erysipelotrichia bacterium]|nr:hypothetical protein [Erysipelotrichia bacterium]
MKKKDEEKIRLELQTKFREVSIGAVASGYRAAMKQVRDIIDKGGTIEDILELADWAISSSEKSEEFAKKTIDNNL